MSKFKSFAKTLGLKVATVSAQAINPVIFATKVNANSFGDVVNIDGVPHLVNVAANTSDVLTPVTIKDAAIAGFTAEKPSAFQVTAIATTEAFGAVTTITFTKDGGVSCPMSIKAFAKDVGMKVTDVEVATQNAVIFSTKGIPSMSGLTKSGDDFYELDLVANTATIVNADALSEKAKADILAGKDSEAVRFVQNFGLVTSLTLSKTLPEA